MLSLKDIDFINLKQITVKDIISQTDKLLKGYSPVHLIKPAKFGDGIIQLSNEKLNSYITLSESESDEYTVVKFVPASGAATRMFKDLISFYNEAIENSAIQNEIITKYPKVKEFFTRIIEFACYPALERSLNIRKTSISELLKKNQYTKILENLLFRNGLNYSQLPKALLDFHLYPDEIRKAIEEHFTEGALYARNKISNNVYLHFTISPEHELLFTEFISSIKGKYEQRFKMSYEVTYSFQAPSTDTVATDENNALVRDDKGNILFRPGGHGALLKNLQNLDFDYIFIKNIDNITTDNLRHDTITYKKALLGFLMTMQNLIHGNIHLLEFEDCTFEDIESIAAFIQNEIHESLDKGYSSFSKTEKRNYLLSKLNRPIRVCGMVKNEGEPGGGPFFTQNENNEISLQIVESAQVDMQNPEQKGIFQSSTHFNPVDIVASVKDYQGKKFNLQNFVDENAYIITSKSKDGREIKALELPGLWNGSMSGWITFFIDVPLSTFTPVKEINDLLREQHTVVKY